MRTEMRVAPLVMVLLSQRALLASGFQLVPARGLYPASPRPGSASVGAARGRVRPLWVAQQIDAAPEVRRRPRSMCRGSAASVHSVCVWCVCARFRHDDHHHPAAVRRARCTGAFALTACTRDPSAILPCVAPMHTHARARRQGPGLSGWRTNPAVKGVESGRTVSLPGYYQDDDKMLPKWAEVP